MFQSTSATGCNACKLSHSLRKAGKGEVDQALALHQEALDVYQELGDRRSYAITLGQIARLKAGKGEVDQALALHQERLEENCRLGDLGGQAGALWDIAQIELARDEVGQAVPRIVEAYQIVDHLGWFDGICVIGETFGQLLVAAGQREEGLAVLRRSEEGFRHMHQEAEAARVAILISQIEGEPIANS